MTDAEYHAIAQATALELLESESPILRNKKTGGWNQGVVYFDKYIMDSMVEDETLIYREDTDYDAEIYIVNPMLETPPSIFKRTLIAFLIWLLQRLQS